MRIYCLQQRGLSLCGFSVFTLISPQYARSFGPRRADVLGHLERARLAVHRHQQGRVSHRAGRAGELHKSRGQQHSGRARRDDVGRDANADHLRLRTKMVHRECRLERIEGLAI
jgi:hypothetical protein